MIKVKLKNNSLICFSDNALYCTYVVIRQAYTTILAYSVHFDKECLLYSAQLN